MPAPDFELPSHNGGAVRLSQFKGQRNVVLFFYPKDNTKYCIVESVQFRDFYEEFVAVGAEVIGVSSDGTLSHQSFAKTYALPFRLLSDEQSAVRSLYGIPATFGVIPGRVTFVIDKAGIIRHIFSSQFSPKSHVDQALAILRTLN